MKRDEFVGKHIQRKSAGWFTVESAEDVLGNILSRLPVKLLLTLKVISKLWHRLIRSPYFTKLHLSQSREKSIYILYPFMDTIRSLYLMDGDGVITGTISLPGLQNLPSLCMIGSYNGLICFTNYPWFPHSFKTRAVVTDLEIRICNPATREVWLLPNGSPLKRELGIGVAFGPGISEYRILRFFCSKSKSEVIRPECEIFSSSTRTWRSLGFIQHCPMGAHHAFVNGKVFWFIPSEEDHNIPGSILSVDLDENFKIIRLPVAVTEHAFLVDLEGCLSLIVVFDDDDIMVIWILKDENESFRNFLGNENPFPNFDPASFIWKSKVPPKVKILGWLVAHGRLNTCDMLQRRRPNSCFSPHWCVLCKMNGESAIHTFLQCESASYLWQKLYWEAGLTWDAPSLISDLFVQNHYGFGKGKKAKVLWGCSVLAIFWVLWMERNRRIFEVYRGVGVEVLWERIRFWVALWASVSEVFKDYCFSSILRDWRAAAV